MINLNDYCEFIIKEHEFPFIDNISESKSCYCFKYIDQGSVNVVSVIRGSFDLCKADVSARYTNCKVPMKYSRLFHDTKIALARVYSPEEIDGILEELSGVDIPCGALVDDLCMIVRYYKEVGLSFRDVKSYSSLLFSVRQHYGIQTPIGVICSSVTHMGARSLVCISEYVDGYSFTLTDYCELTGNYDVVWTDKSGVVLSEALDSRFVSFVPVSNYTTRASDCLDIIRVEYPDRTDYTDLLSVLLDCRFSHDFGPMDIVFILRYWDFVGLAPWFLRLENSEKLKLAREHYLDSIF